MTDPVFTTRADLEKWVVNGCVGAAGLDKSHREGMYEYITRVLIAHSHLSSEGEAP
jgi:hypothetical protein